MCSHLIHPPKYRSRNVQSLENMDAGRTYLRSQETLACEIRCLCIGCRLGIVLVYNVYSRGSLLDALPVRCPKDALHASDRSLWYFNPKSGLLAMRMVSIASTPRM